MQRLAEKVGMFPAICTNSPNVNHNLRLLGHCKNDVFVSSHVTRYDSTRSTFVLRRTASTHSQLFPFMQQTNRGVFVANSLLNLLLKVIRGALQWWIKVCAVKYWGKCKIHQHVSAHTSSFSVFHHTSSRGCLCYSHGKEHISVCLSFFFCLLICLSLSF